MKERPILYSGEMVRAILDGRKTKTRRIMKRPPLSVEPYNTPNVIIHTNNGTLLDRWYRFNKETDGIIDTRRAGVFGPKTKRAAEIAADHLHWYKGASGIRWSIDEVVSSLCPYGVPGDRLWARETWRVGSWDLYKQSVAVDYKADGYCRREWIKIDDYMKYLELQNRSIFDAEKVFGKRDHYSWEPGDSPCRWRPSIFMPRWASRITLEITDVRVERLREITEEDAWKEGVHEFIDRKHPYIDKYGTGVALAAFSNLWDSIYGKQYPWESNPWVWVISFRKI